MSEHNQHQSREQYYEQEVQYQVQAKNNFVKPIVIVVVALVLITLSFFGGIQYQKGHKPKAPSFGSGSSNPFGSGGVPSGGPPSGVSLPGGGSSTTQ